MNEENILQLSFDTLNLKDNLLHEHILVWV